VRLAVNLEQLPRLSQCFSDRGFADDRANTQVYNPAKKFEHPPQPKIKAQFHQAEDWRDLVKPLANYYRQFGTGIFANYLAFRWYGNQSGWYSPSRSNSSRSLVGYEYQKELLLKNTEALLAGYPALNALLYGSRGSGKSSLVKSLLNLYGDRGLRLIDLRRPICKIYR
jgi:predicted AAA+ superfamily ATPase